MSCLWSGRREVSNPPKLPSLPPVTEADIDTVLTEFDGDPRAAIRALLEDIATLAYDHVTTASLGFSRGEVMAGRLRRRGRR